MDGICCSKEIILDFNSLKKTILVIDLGQISSRSGEFGYRIAIYITEKKQWVVDLVSQPYSG